MYTGSHPPWEHLCDERTRCLCFPNVAECRPQVEFNVALRPQRLYGLLGMVSPGRPPRLSHSSWALRTLSLPFSAALRPQRLYGLLGTGSPGWPPQLSHSSWALNYSQTPRTGSHLWHASSNHCHNLLTPHASNASKFVTTQAAQITSGSYIRLPAQIITRIIQIRTTIFFIQARHSLMFTCMLQCYVASTVVTKCMEGIRSKRLTAVISVDRCTEIISAPSVQWHNLLRQSLEEGCQKAKLEV